MTEKDYYLKLLQRMVKIADNLERAIAQLTTFKTNLTNGITINDIVYKDNDITLLSNDIANQLRSINDIIIPGIRNRLERIEE